MDSAAGVARFWLGEQVGLVERCLVDLHHQGLLERRTISGTDFFSLQEKPPAAVGAEPHSWDAAANPSLRDLPASNLEDGYLSVLISLIGTIEDLRPETRDRSKRVAETATLIAVAMGVPQSQIQLLKRAAVLHGVGRLIESAGNGSDKSSDERNGVAAFLATERMLAPIASLHDVREIILRAIDWPETGRSLLEVSHVVIPLESRILAVSEDFVRGTAGGKLNPKIIRAALKRICGRSGEQHDSAVVKALCGLVERGDMR
ncbi:MAG: hypothetical protein E2P01_05910 [Acidobacteria bacterium]|nr:MAG: hypothetical protein E2P01_05910 [Acidobacteriota bacterium]